MNVEVRAIPEEELVRLYLRAKRTVIESKYASEIVWQRSRKIEDVSLRTFFQEAVWVVLSSGMRESVVAQRYPVLSAELAGLDPYWIASHDSEARSRALSAFNHPGKIDAIIAIASRIARLGEVGLRQELQHPEGFLKSLPYIGSVTWRHLAKNLGLGIAKPDRHLVRLAVLLGYASVDVMCAELSEWLNEPLSVVDLVLWRWAVLHSSQCRALCLGLPHV